jgi:penicillin-binding protein 1A
MLVKIITLKRGMDFYVVTRIRNAMRTYFQLIGDRLKTFFPNKNFKQIFLRLALFGILVILIPFFTLVILVWAGVFGKLPDKEALTKIQNPLASEVYSADSVLLGRYFIQERSFVPADEIPKSLKEALIATEDIRFYDHHGIDYRSVGRVLFKSVLLQKESSGGGSTITQQLAKNLFPRKNYAMLSLPINKIREILIAWRIENVYSKDEILALYLNTIPFADNIYGIKTAADRFFSTPIKSLTLDQSAVLIGMLKATHYYNPRLFPERALERRNVVIAQVARYGYITALEKNELQKKEIGLKYNYTSHNAGLAPYFRAYIQQELLNWCRTHKKDDGTAYNLFTDGLKIYTTIDSRLQRYAEDAMAKQMKVLQSRFEGQLTRSQLQHIAISHVRQLPQYKALKETGLSENQILEKLKKPVMTKIFTWDGEKEAEISIYDSLKHHLQFLQAGILATNPATGEILAWVGGINHEYFQFDHVRESTKRQVGSTIKPIIYAAALESGIEPCDYISGNKTVYSNLDKWSPENTDAETYDKKYSMEGGLTGSVNTVSVKLIEQTGVQNAIGVARRMGITSELPAVPSIALGTPSISLKEMVGAYGVLANGGLYVAPKYIQTITDRNGKPLESIENKKEKAKRALSNETTRMMIHMMQSVVSSGTGSSLRSRYGLTNDIAGKTGTTQSNVDGWFIAITPKLVVGAWVGADDPQMHFRTTAMGQGAATALPIVAKFFQQANQDPALRRIMFARFQPLPENLADKMDCALSKSDLNIFHRIFKTKKKVKVAKFKGKRTKEPS